MREYFGFHPLSIYFWKKHLTYCSVSRSTFLTFEVFTLEKQLSMCLVFCIAVNIFLDFEETLCHRIHLMNVHGKISISFNRSVPCYSFSRYTTRDL